MPASDRKIGRMFADYIQQKAGETIQASRQSGKLVEVENENGVTSVFVYDEDGNKQFNQLWCQLDNEPNPIVVWGWMVQPQVDLPVWVDNYGDGYEIYRPRSEDGTNFAQEALQSVGLGYIVNEVNKFSLVGRNYQPGMCIFSDQGGLVIYVYPLRYFAADGTPVSFGGGTLDLTAYLPATSGTWAWVQVCIDPTTNELTAVTSDEFAGPALLTPDILDTIDTANLIPLDAVKVAEGATALDATNEWAMGRLFTQHHLKHNFAATTAPTVNDDETLGYEVGSIWIDVSTGATYFCSDNSTGAAVWNAASSPTLYYQTLEDGGTPVTQRSATNFIEGTGITLTFNDDAGNDRTDITIDATAGGSNYQTIQDNGVDETQRGKLNLIEGSNITLTFSDNAGNNSTDVTIASTGGGGSATGTLWEPRAAPASPSGSDDEFADASGGVPSGFTEVDFGTNTTVNEAAYGVLLTQTTHAGNSVAGIYKAIPDANFSFWTRVSQIIPFTTTGGGTANKIGLALFQDATDSAGDIFTFHLDFGGSATIGYQGIRYPAYNSGSPVGVFGVVGGNLASGLPSAFLRIRFDGTTYFCDFSVDGYTVLQAGSVTAATLGYTPSHMGLMINNVNTGSTTSALFQFFRYAASDVGVVPMAGQRVNYYA